MKAMKKPTMAKKTKPKTKKEKMMKAPAYGKKASKSKKGA